MISIFGPFFTFYAVRSSTILGGGSTWTSPCRWGRAEGGGGGNGSCRGRNGGRPPPPPEMGVKMFELAQLNLFTPERKKGGGGPLAFHRQLLVRAGLGEDGVWG